MAKARKRPKRIPGLRVFASDRPRTPLWHACEIDFSAASMCRHVQLSFPLAISSIPGSDNGSRVCLSFSADTWEAMRTSKPRLFSELQSCVRMTSVYTRGLVAKKVPSGSR